MTNAFPENQYYFPVQLENSWDSFENDPNFDKFLAANNLNSGRHFNADDQSTRKFFWMLWMTSKKYGNQFPLTTFNWTNWSEGKQATKSSDIKRAWNKKYNHQDEDTFLTSNDMNWSTWMLIVWNGWVESLAKNTLMQVMGVIRTVQKNQRDLSVFI